MDIRIFLRMQVGKMLFPPALGGGNYIMKTPPVFLMCFLIVWYMLHHVAIYVQNPNCFFFFSKTFAHFPNSLKSNNQHAAATAPGCTARRFLFFPVENFPPDRGDFCGWQDSATWKSGVRCPKNSLKPTKNGGNNEFQKYPPGNDKTYPTKREKQHHLQNAIFGVIC